MRNSHSDFGTVEGLTVRDLEAYFRGWMHEGKRDRSPHTLTERRSVVGKFLWFLRDREYACVGRYEVRDFLAYVATAHEDEGGRWGRAAADARLAQAPKPATAHAYFRTLRALFNWVQVERPEFVSPMRGLKAPRIPNEQPEPFTPDQVNALRAAVSSSKGDEQSRRNEALVLFLLDTGCRAAEACALKRGGLDLVEHRVRVLGKGRKARLVYFGRETTRALWSYLQVSPAEEETPLFLSERNRALTPNGLGQIIRRLGRQAGLRNVRCSPHTFRHSFAVSFLRNGGNVYELQMLIGHETLTMLQRYVKLAAVDVELAHRRFSPADRLGR